MNEQKKTYEELLLEMGEPIDIDTMPNRNIDYVGLLKYARQKGVKVSELSIEERNSFILQN